jgi:hypothetical protein
VIFANKFVFTKGKDFKSFKRPNLRKPSVIFGPIKPHQEREKRNETESKCRIYLKREEKTRKIIIDIRDFFLEKDFKEKSWQIFGRNASSYLLEKKK